MDTKDTKKPTLAEAVSAWAAASYALTVAANVRGCITDTSGLAPAWWRHGQRLRREAWSLMEGAISGRSRDSIPGLDYGMTGRIFDPYSGSGGLGPAEILARGELLAAGVQNAEAIGELVLEFRESDRRRDAQRLADVVFTGPEIHPIAAWVVNGPALKADERIRIESGPVALDDPTMTPEEFGRYREQEEDAKERESWSAEEDTAWIDDTDSLPSVPEGFDPFDPLAALEERGETAPDTTHEEDPNR